jgi:predicted XRE-type DNA-binding protein
MPGRYHVNLKKFYKDVNHSITFGTTGSGKTNWLIDLAVDFFNPQGLNNTVLWRDVAKANEFLALSQYGPLKIFMPDADVKMKIKGSLSSIESVRFESYDDIFDHLDKDKFNVISFLQFCFIPKKFTQFWSYFFQELVIRASNGQIEVPLVLAMDEMNQVCPSADKQVDVAQGQLSNMIAFNVERLRACNVRCAFASHGVTKIKKNVRTSTPWQFYKYLGEKVSGDVPRLKFTESIIQQLKVDQVIAVAPDKIYSDPINGIENYYLKEIGKFCNVKYEGTLPVDWEAHSKYAEMQKLQNEKQDGRQKKDLLKNIIAHLVQENVFTQAKIATIAKCSPARISQIMSEIKDDMLIGEVVDVVKQELKEIDGATTETHG